MTTDTVSRRDSMDTTIAVIMVCLTFVWGFNQVAIKIATEGFSPVFLAVVRSAIAGVLVWSWCMWRGIVLTRKDGTLWPGLLAGLLFGLEFLLIFFAMELTTAARAVLMLNTMPFWILIGAHLLLGERMSLVKFAGLLLAFGGIVLVFSDDISLPGPEAIRGDIMMLAAAFLWACTTLVIKRSSLASVPAEKTLLYQLVVSALIAVPALPFSAPHLREITFWPVAALMFQSVFVVAFTFLVWFRMMRIYPAAGLSSFTFLTPVFGVISGGLVLNEPLGTRIFIALALIAAGLYIVNRRPGTNMRVTP